MDNFKQITNHYERMSGTDKKIAIYIVNETDKVIKANIHKLAKALEVSSSSITRFVHKYFNQSFSEFKINLASAKDSDAYSQSQEMFNWADSISDMPNHIIASISDVCNDVVRANEEQKIRDAINWIAQAKTVYLFAVGASGIVASDLQQKLMRLEKCCVYHTDNNFGVLNARIATKEDLVIAISFSGRTKEVLLAVKEAKKSGVRCLTLTRDVENPLQDISDLSLVVPSNELNATRLAPVFSRYGQLFIVDMLFLGVAKQITNSADDFMQQYHELLEELKV